MNALTELQTLRLPDESDLARPANAAVRMAQTFVIADREDYGMAAEELKSVKAKAKALEEKRTAITGPLNAATKLINDLFRGPQAALAEAEDLFKRSMIAFDNEQERKEREANAARELAAQAERERLAEEEARILAAAAAEKKKRDDEQAERDRVAAEKQRIIDAEASRLRAAGDLAAADAADAAVKALAAAAEAGRVEAQRLDEQAAQTAAVEVAAVQATAVVTTAPAVATLRPSVSGISTSKRRTYKLKNLHEVVVFVAANPQFLSAVKLDDIKVRALVNGMGEAFPIPGIEVTEEKTMAARAA